MRPRVLAHLLGLCNLVAGAFLLFRPDVLLAGVDGAQTVAARLLSACAAVFLLGVAAGAWCLPAPATRAYLWIFGVAVKLAGALAWGAAAVETGAGTLWAGAVLDAMIAIAIATALSLPRAGD
ncbi:MAG TPA: hypothetical protein VMF13_15990 [Luteitalea sp.]|nr:hypothetical protein [Luteitalea sp.]